MTRQRRGLFGVLLSEDVYRVQSSHLVTSGPLNSVVRLPLQMMYRYQLFVVLLTLCGCSEHRTPPTQSSMIASNNGHSKTKTTAEQRGVVNLTPTAVAKFREAQKQDGKPFLRVAVVFGGTTGFMYDLTFDDRIDDENDYIDEVDGIMVIVDKRSSLFLEGATIDWQVSPDGQQGFHFENPNAVE